MPSAPPFVFAYHASQSSPFLPFRASFAWYSQQPPAGCRLTRGRLPTWTASVPVAVCA